MAPKLQAAAPDLAALAMALAAKRRHPWTRLNPTALHRNQFWEGCSDVSSAQGLGTNLQAIQDQGEKALSLR